VRIARATLLCIAVVAVGVVLVSGGSDGDPRTPAALPGLPPPFLGTALSGDGGLTAAIDAYGDVVDLRAPGPAGAALIDDPSDRQAAETVPSDTGIVPRVRIGGGPALPMWRADSVTQRYLGGTNVVRTVARFGGVRVTMTTVAAGGSLAVVVGAQADRGTDAGRVVPSLLIDVTDGVRCARERRAGQLDLLCRVGRAVPPVSGAAAGDAARGCSNLIGRAARDARRWLQHSLPLGSRDGQTGGRFGGGRAVGSTGADHRREGSRSPGLDPPGWARSMYRRSLLTIHALTSRATGAVAAGARDGWAYVWPRDAATAALALDASGHRAEARAVARLLAGLDLGAAARFDEAGAPVPGRAAQGDATGWVDAAATATGVPIPSERLAWRDRADYQESSPGTYLGNALAATVTNWSADRVDGPKTQPWLEFSAHQPQVVTGVERIAGEFGTAQGLVRRAGDPGSGLDSAAGWAVRPFGLSPLYPAAERTLLGLVRRRTPYGITPGEGWEGGADPWTAPTAWSAWALAGLAAETERRCRRASGRRRCPSTDARREADRRAALELLTDLRRASTPAGDLPERVGVHTGVPTSTTPLLWSSAFTVLALRELWP
jgi:glucoamylase